MLTYKISATDSTNSYLKGLLKEYGYENEIAVITHEQSQGRGQRGTVWHSQKGKSLTFSVFIRLDGFDVRDQFYVSMVVSLTVKTVLEYYQIPRIKIKWPNDILSANKKLCGILIENILQHDKIKGCIIGIGLNVNETCLNDLPEATSMKLTTGRTFHLEEVFNRLLDVLHQKKSMLTEKRFSEIEHQYLKNLYGIHKVCVFQNTNKQIFNGIIKGVSQEGKLQVETENGSTAVYNLKEIKMLAGLQRC